MKVIMTGGGTGGHVYPAIAIADKIKEHQPDAEILFVGTEKGIEKRLVPEYGYDIEFITVKGFDRTNMLHNFDVPAKLLKGRSDAKKIVKQFKPDICIATGGYVSLPVAQAAHAYGARVFLHEQNAFPGMANKMLEKKAEKVFLGFRNASKHFKYPQKHVLSGNPVRKGFLKTGKEEARKALGYGKNDFVILSFGGSQGAGRINKAMMGVIEHYNGNRKIRICMATGKRYYEAIMQEFAEKGITLKKNIEVVEYINEMNKYIAAADLLICRSGALSVAEASVCGTPAIFIPLPTATNNHQYHNAKAVADYGGAIVINEDKLTVEDLIKEIDYLEEHRCVLADMSDAEIDWAYDDAADMIYKHLNID